MAKDNTVSFDSILVNSISSNSGIFVGSNSQSSWNSCSNNKSGFGDIIGNGNTISRGVHIFMDNDVIDTPIAINHCSDIRKVSSMGVEDNIRIYGCRGPGWKCGSSL